MALRAPLLACLLLGGWAAAAAGQRVGATLAPDSATVGEVVQAALAVELPAGWSLALPDSVDVSGDVENAGARALAADSLPGGGRRITARYPLVAWRPGEHPLPPLEVVLVAPENAARERRTVTLPSLRVLSVLPADTAGLEPRPPKDVLGPTRSPWAWLLVALLLAAAVALGVWLARRRRRGGEGGELEPWVSPRERALEELERVRAAGLLERGEIKAFCGGVTAALRGYLEALEPRWGTDLTTRELRGRIDGGLPPVPRGELLALLEEADTIKFAGRRAEADAARAQWERARRWVEALPEPGAADNDGEEGGAGGAEEPPSSGAGAGPGADGAAGGESPSSDAAAGAAAPADEGARFRPPGGRP